MSRKLVNLKKKIVQAGADESKIAVITPHARVRGKGTWLKGFDNEGQPAKNEIRGEGNTVTEPMKPEKFDRITKKLKPYASAMAKLAAQTGKRK